MTQLTIRGFDKDVERCLRRLAREQGISLNKAAVLLLRRGAGLSEVGGEPDVVGTSLDELIGSWSARHAAAVSRAVEAFGAVDDELWK